ncbi:hypothetical protein HF086_009255 [Spodoptera exigua]|uniref:DUF5641 domain-containing protein n=1 Tax=Spodoptera exigua TaxID=7107 RepID=A0A922MDJ9_SPOEX|nr:hypothetical protein HF086_009255 [Spodoptera exigua]
MRTRWQLTQKIIQDVWKRWRTEYLTQLTSRSKWRRPHENIKMNDVVLIHDENLPPGKWTMGRVVKLHPGQDGYVRVVTVKTKNGYMQRPVIKLSILTEHAEVPDDKQNDQVSKKQQVKLKRNKTSLTAICTAILFL